MTETMIATRIGLEVFCEEPTCTQFARPLFEQLSEGYEECAVLPLEGVGVWREAHRTARKRADRAARRGYTFASVRRHERAHEVQAINLSMPVRQGRPMSDGYRLPPSTDPLPEYPCSRHGVRTFGVETDAGELVAYCWIYRAGDLALVSQILGHQEHLANEVMYLLMAGVIEAESPLGGYLVYGRWDSGTEGLRFFKSRCGFEPTAVQWSQW